jgi:hypothetical protein
MLWDPVRKIAKSKKELGAWWKSIYVASMRLKFKLQNTIDKIKKQTNEKSPKTYQAFTESAYLK